MIVITDYGIGNLQSVQRAFRRLGADAAISCEAQDLLTADKIVLPGVGSFAEGMTNLASRGFLPILNRKVRQEGTPFLGICVGFQMLTNRSEEGNAEGLGWIDAETKRFRFEGAGSRYRIPHMGWNDLSVRTDDTLLSGLSAGSCFYFAHSYYVTCHDEGAVLATTQYGREFVSVMQKDNIFGTQFHPEKSQVNGLAVLRNFLEYH
jgi:glutamine amidotransferase